MSRAKHESAPDRGDIYLTLSDMVDSPEDWLTTEDANWRDYPNVELRDALQNVTGSCYNEPDILVAVQDSSGIYVFGADRCAI